MDQKRRREGIVYRAKTHTARKTEFSEKDLLEQEEFHDSIQESLICDEVPYRDIINFDQTSMQVVVTTKRTLDSKGAKQVRVVEPPGEKNTFTVGLAIQADGTKFPAVIIFRASNKETGVLSEKILNELVIPANIVIESSGSGWWTEESTLTGSPIRSAITRGIQF